MPSESSQMISGIVAMPWTGAACFEEVEQHADARRIWSGPPITPSIARSGHQAGPDIR